MITIQELRQYAKKVGKKVEKGHSICLTDQHKLRLDSKHVYFYKKDALEDKIPQSQCKLDGYCFKLAERKLTVFI